MACPSPQLAELLVEQMRDGEDFVREQRIQRFSSPARDDWRPWFGSVVSSDAALATLRAELTSNLDGDDWLRILTRRKREIDAFRSTGMPVPTWASVREISSPSPRREETRPSFCCATWWRRVVPLLRKLFARRRELSG